MPVLFDEADFAARPQDPIAVVERALGPLGALVGPAHLAAVFGMDDEVALLLADHAVLAQAQDLQRFR